MKPTRKQHQAGVARLNAIFGYGGPQPSEAFPGRRERRARNKRARASSRRNRA